jgi:hypothetical protein
VPWARNHRETPNIGRSGAACSAHIDARMQAHIDAGLFRLAPSLLCSLLAALYSLLYVLSFGVDGMGCRRSAAQRIACWHLNFSAG